MQKQILCSLLFLSTILVSANCNNTYSAVSYVLNHAKKSLAANNFDHQKYYAERALEALEKTVVQAKVCGCDKAISVIYDGMENLEKAIDQDDWDMGRYYTKKAYENTQNIINELDVFTQGGQQNVDNDQEVTAISTSPRAKTLLSELEELKKQQIKLAEQQKLLEEQRKALEKKIEEANL